MSQSFSFESCHSNLAFRNWVGQKLGRNKLSSYLPLCHQRVCNVKRWKIIVEVEKSFIIMFHFSVLKILTTN